MKRAIYLFGNLAYHDENGVVRWADTGEEVMYNGSGPIAENRRCPQCNLKQINGMDPCLGKLPGVKAACCGHGVAQAYIAFENKVAIHFNGPADLIVNKGKKIMRKNSL